MNVGIIAACIPTLKPLFDPSRPSILRYIRSRKTADTPNQEDDSARLTRREGESGALAAGRKMQDAFFLKHGIGDSSVSEVKSTMSDEIA